MYIVFFLITVIASLAGAICGVGGGIIIKPTLDAFGGISTAAISFLSGCTVLSMTIYSVTSSKLKKESHINFRVCTALAIGSIIGGIIGKTLFEIIWSSAANKSLVGLIQSICLVIMTGGTLIYTLNTKRIHTHNIVNLCAVTLLGLFLGMLSSFLGIGGGPINLVVLFYFFSMEIKEAAENSLFIILFSQASSLISTIVTHTVPQVNISMLALMICGGLIGGIAGKKINRIIRPKTVNKLFITMMSVIIVVSTFNLFKFLSSP